MWLTDHHVAETKRQLKPNTSMHYLTIKIDTTTRRYTYDLRHNLENIAGQTRSIYGSRGRAPMREDGHPAGRDKHNHVRAESRRRTPSELRRDLARYRGTAHALCFIDEVMEHEFPEGFKPVNIESYDGTTDPAVWIDDFLLHIHMAPVMIFTPSNISH